MEWLILEKCCGYLNSITKQIQPPSHTYHFNARPDAPPQTHWRELPKLLELSGWPAPRLVSKPGKRQGREGGVSWSSIDYCKTNKKKTDIPGSLNINSSRMAGTNSTNLYLGLSSLPLDITRLASRGKTKHYKSLNQCHASKWAH